MNNCPVPIAEHPARLDWKLEYDTIYADPPWLIVRLVPGFPQCNPTINETSIVFDLFDLFNSAKRPGGYFLLNCTCGDSSHAGIEEMVFVSHPDADTVIWELDVPGLSPALADCWQSENGFLRLVFNREEYETDIRAMLGDVRSAGSASLPVERLEPNFQGLAYERAMALRCDEYWPREPVLRAGTLLEFGLFGPNLLLINGKPDLGWPIRLFTRWSALAAFKRWIGYVSRGYALRYEFGDDASGINLSWFTEPERRNDFFLLRETERTACDKAGAAFVRTLRACFAEGATAPGVKVRYRACRSPAVLSETVAHQSASKEI